MQTVHKSLAALAAILLLVASSPAAVLANTVIVVQTDHQIGGGGGYDGYEEIDITGTVTPNPPGTSVTVAVTNPNGVVMSSVLEPVDLGANGYEDLVVMGCTPDWVSGIYTITTTLQASPPITASTTFMYLADPPTADNISLKATPQDVTASGTVSVSGTVEACSGSAGTTSVLLSVKNPGGQLVYSGAVPVIATDQPEDGNFSLQLAAGSNPNWIPGTYTAIGYYSSNSNAPAPASASATFVYSNSTQSSTTSATTKASSSSFTSSSTTATTSTAPSTQSTVSSSSSSSTKGGSTTPAPSSLGSTSILIIVAIGAGIAASFVGIRSRGKKT